MRLSTIKTIEKERAEKKRLYKSAKIITPLKSVEDDGIFLGTDGAYSKMIKFSDLNYSVLTNAEKKNFIME